MKIKNTLLFMLWNPIPIIVYFLGCWILLSASITMSDDPFVHGALPDAVEAAEGAFANLPGSLWKLVTALSIIAEEISRDFVFTYSVWPIVIPPALILGYREARSSWNGIATERKMWMQWYDRQQLVKAERGIYETPPLSEHIPGSTYFISAQKTVLFIFRHPILPAGHFVCWFTLFALPILFDGRNFVRMLPDIAIPAVIFTLILSYREARSNLKGIAIERGIWSRWYHRQSKAIEQGNPFEEPPSSENMESYAYFGEIRGILSFMARNPIPFIIHLTCWVFISAFLFVLSLSLTLSPEKMPNDIWDLIELIGIFGVFLPWIVLIAFLISYREAKGTLKGTAKERRKWMRWYTQQQSTERQDDAFAEPLLADMQVDSYFGTSQKALDLIIRNPLSFVVHFAFCFLAAVLVNIIPSYLSIFEVARGLMGSLPQLALISVILALISSYQEARGTVKGTAKEAEVWTKWYQRQTGANAQGYTLAEVPPAINMG